MLGLGLASSHGAGIWRTAEQWGDAYEHMPPERKNYLPYTAKLEGESLEVRKDYYQRLRAGFAALREQFQAYQPDALIMIGDDQDDMFDMVCNPTFSIYTGADPIWGVDVRDGRHGQPVETRKKSTGETTSNFRSISLRVS